MSQCTKTSIHPTHKRTEIEQARRIAATLGVYTAARYLALREWSMEAALYILLGK